MYLSDLGEFGFIERIRRLVPPGGPGVVLGIGDDTAALQVSGDMLLLATCDTLLEGRHFHREEAFPSDLGRRAAAVALSDIAAMGGLARYALLTLGLPRQEEVAFAEGLIRGLSRELQRFDATLVGGNLVESRGGIVLDVVVLGEVRPEEMVRRQGAQPGDVLLVTGSLGGATARRLAQQRGLSGVAGLDVPTPRLAEGRFIASRRLASAMIDLSDGLAQDLLHLCDASDVGAILWAGQIPVAEEARRLAPALGLDPAELALGGGEDYELLLAAPPHKVEELRLGLPQATGTPLTVIGVVHPKGEGRWLALPDGQRRPLEVRGWDHFSSASTSSSR